MHGATKSAEGHVGRSESYWCQDQYQDAGKATDARREVITNRRFLAPFLRAIPATRV